MAHYRISRRYARALLTLADEQGLLSEVNADLEMIAGTIRKSRELELFLASPIIHKDKKQQSLQAIFGKRVKPLTLNFLRLLAAKGRERILASIIEQYRRLLDEKLGIVRVEIASTVKLEQKQEKKLIAKLEAVTSKKVEAQFSLDKNLRGGFIARIGDTVIDASVRRQLELLMRRFVGDGSITN